MATIMDKETYQEIDDILDLAESIVVFFNLVPTGRAEDMVKVNLSPEEREEFMKEVYRQMKKRKLEILTTAPQYARYPADEQWKRGNTSALGASGRR